MVTSWKQEPTWRETHLRHWCFITRSGETSDADLYVQFDPQIILNCNLALSTESGEINDKGYHGDHGNSFAESQQQGAQFKSCTQPVL